MELPVTAMEALAERAAFLKEWLLKSQSITDSMVSILGSFDHRLSALETAMRPTQIRTHSVRTAHKNIDKTLKESEIILHHIDLSSQAEARILRGPHEDLESYIQAIDQLKSNVKFFSDTKHFRTNNAAQTRAKSLLSGAFAKIEDEFRSLLALNSKPAEPGYLYECLPKSVRPSSVSQESQGKTNSNSSTHSTDKESESIDDRQLTLMPPHVIPLLQSLADLMVEAGYQHQALRTYRETRSIILEMSLTKLGVEALAKDDLQNMPWEVLEAKIGNWIQYIQIAVKLLFPGEKKCIDQIFHGIDSIRTLCFAEVASNSVAMMFSFGDAISRSKRSPEKLFVLLDMYEIMRELLPEIKSTFEGKPCTGVRESAAGLTKRLGQTAQETFSEFDVAVEKDATRSAVLDGTVHPLTSYVINYLKFILDYQSTLKLLFQDCGCHDANSQLASVTARVVEALLNNLDGKSKLYKDPALTQLFLMNNVHYIVRSVRSSDAKDLLGDDWVQVHRRVVQQHANQYKRAAWSKILQCITVTGNLSKGIIKDRLKNFNIQFEELHHRQSQWTIPDSELRESLRLAVAEVLLPAYRSFTKRFGPSIYKGKFPNKSIKYTPEHLEHKLSEFFEGKISAEQRR